MYPFTYESMYVCMNKYMYLRVHVKKDICVHMFTCVFVCIYMGMYIVFFVCIYV